MKKIHLSKKALTALILLAVFALTLVGYLVAKDAKPKETQTTASSTSYRLYPALSLVDKATAVTLEVHPKLAAGADEAERETNKPYVLQKSQSGTSFGIYYYDYDQEDYVLFYPEYCQKDPFFNYADLYATADFGYGSFYRFVLLGNGVGDISYTYSIDLADESELVRYGLGAGCAYFKLSETESGVTTDVTVHVGDATPGNSGYYIYLGDDASKVYVTNSNMLVYALKPVTYYINPRLISSGLTSTTSMGLYDDNIYEPFFVSEIRETKNTSVIYDSQKGTQTIPDGFAELIFRGTLTDYTPVKDEDGNLTPASDAGARQTYAYTDMTDTVRKKLAGAAPGLALGATALQFSEMGTAVHTLDFSDTDAIDLVYNILRVDAVLVSGGADVTTGKVGEAANVLVTLKKGTDETEWKVALAIGALKDKGAVSDAEYDALKNADVGVTFETPVTLHVQYTKTAAQSYLVKENYTILANTVPVRDDDGKYTYDTSGNKQYETSVAPISAESVVYFSLTLTLDGVTITEAAHGKADMAQLKDKNSAYYDLDLYNKFFGVSLTDEAKKKDGKTVVTRNSTQYTDAFYGERIFTFVTFEVDEFYRYVTDEEVFAFSYVKTENRDPFYGEAIYKNVMKNEGKAAYGINDGMCATVRSLLGGISESGSVSSSDGLSGYETVAIGLSPEVMETYSLYDNTIVYQTPRGLVDEDGTYSLTFTLYISDEKRDAETGTLYRYVGSDLYDVVAKVYAETLTFMNYSYEEAFARDSLFMIDYRKIETMTVTPGWEGASGTYTIVKRYETYPVTDSKGKTVVATEDVAATDESGEAVYDSHGDPIIIKAGEERKIYVAHYWLEATGYENDTFAGKALLTKKGGEILLNELYNELMAGGRTAYFTSEFGERDDTLAGDGYFLNWLYIWNSSHYVSAIDGAYSSAGADPLFTFDVTLNNEKTYTYKFTRVADRVVTVSLVLPGREPVEEYYISTFNAKKIINGFVDMLNAERVDGNDGYGD